jgi:hypothetical protein
MSLHKEINFESEICQHLAANGWLYAEGDAANYDRCARIDAAPGRKVSKVRTRFRFSNWLK